MFYVEIKYSFDDDIYKSKNFATHDLAYQEMMNLLFAEMRICIYENETDVKVNTVMDEEKLVVLTYEACEDFAEYRVKQMR